MISSERSISLPIILVAIKAEIEVVMVVAIYIKYTLYSWRILLFS